MFVGHYIPLNVQYGNYPTIASFTVNVDGTLNFVGTCPTGDYPQAVALSPNGRYLAVSHGTSSTTTEQLRLFRVNADASLTQVLLKLVPDSPMDLVWVNNYVLAVLETKVGGTNRVHTYWFDEDLMTLTAQENEAVGRFNAYLALHPSRHFLYTGDTYSDSDLWVRTVRVGGSGQLSPADSIRTYLYALGMGVSNDGERLYAGCGIGRMSGGDSHRIHGFSLDQTTGLPTPLDGSPFYSPGTSPKCVAFTADDQILLAGHGTDSTIRSFFIDPQEGWLTETGFLYDVGDQGNLGAMKMLDDLLIVTHTSNDSAGARGLLSLKLAPDGSFFVLGGGVYATGGVVPKPLAVWKPRPQLIGDINDDGLVEMYDLQLFVAVLLGTPVDPAHVGRSDLNGDGAADGLDIPLMIDALLNQTAGVPGDINGDGDVDELDLPLFIAALLGTPQQPAHVLRSDVNRDGSTDGSDVQAWLLAYLGPPKIGACCRIDGLCTVLTDVVCGLTPYAVFLGDGTTCEECPGIPTPYIAVVYFDAPPPYCNTPGSTVYFSIIGGEFAPTATARLRQSGQADLIPIYLEVRSSEAISAQFSLSGAPPGTWNLVVINPDGQTATGPVSYVIQNCP